MPKDIAAPARLTQSYLSIFFFRQQVSFRDEKSGFHSHPHRGMSTVSYMTQGSFEHEVKLPFALQPLNRPGGTFKLTPAWPASQDFAGNHGILSASTW